MFGTICCIIWIKIGDYMLTILNNLFFQTTTLLEKIYILIAATFILYILYLIIIILTIYIKKNKAEK